MERYWNNKGKILLSPKFLALCSILLALCIVLCLLLYPNTASSGPYLDSAHANTSYGVNRSGLSSFGYSIGNCAHCHEQHASIGGSEPAQLVVLLQNMNYFNHYLLIKAVLFASVVIKTRVFRANI